jgi:glycosyltransferase involved in cell wall biosynthesis
MVGHNPRISIVTPSLNQAQFLEHAIRSVIDQNYPNLEYIVIDGGSTDGSLEVIKRYEKHISFWVSERDSGHGHALNKGFSRATGEIMAWLNSDDMYLPWTFKTVAEIFSNKPDVDWLTGIPIHWDRNNRIVHVIEGNYKNKFDFLIGRYDWIQQESTFWRRRLWEAAGGEIDTSYKLMVDGELWSRFFQYASLYHVSCILGGWRAWGGNRSSKQMTECHEEMRRCIEAMMLNCNDSTLRKVDKIKFVQRFPVARKGILFRKIAERMLGLDSIAKDIGYDTLIPRDNGWDCIRVPFWF